MPKTWSTALKAHMASSLRTVCTCWKIIRRDGQEFYFTDHDKDVIFSGETYRSSIGYSRTAMAANTDFSTDNLDISGIFDDETITATELRSGLFDQAEVFIFLINYLDHSMGAGSLRRGFLGDVTGAPSGVFHTTLNGLIVLLNHTVGKLLTSTCMADLGDLKCGVDLSTFTVAGEVTTVTSQKVFNVSYPSPDPRAESGWFDGGVVTFTSGANNGRSMEVRNYVAGGIITLFLPMPMPIIPGDTFEVYPGCNKKIEHCHGRFDNIVNMRAFPHVPGSDYMARAPQQGSDPNVAALDALPVGFGGGGA